MNPKPWNKPQPSSDENQNNDGASAAGEVVGGVVEGVGEVVGGSLEAAGGCAEGCGGCAAAVLIALFAAAGTAMAVVM